jgi:hypothetical protein
MGILGHQEPRNYFDVKNSDIQHRLLDIKAWAKQHNMSPADVIATIRVMELKRHNDILVDAGDKLDENLGGFGDYFQELLRILSEVEAKYTRK